MDGILLSEHVSISVIGPGLLVIKCLRSRLSMALELAKHNPVYEDIASKFFEASYLLRLDYCQADVARSILSSSQMP